MQSKENAMSTGYFTTEFAKKKTWKLDERLFRAIKSLLEENADPDEHVIIDLGAGVGRYVEALRKAGWRYTIGVDAIPDVNRLSDGLVIEADLTDGSLWERMYASAKGPPNWRPDVAMFIETAEHVPFEHHPNMWNNIADSVRTGGLLIVSVAVPGQRGRGHVSCMLPESVANQLGLLGCRLDQSKTIAARKMAGKGWDKKLLVLRRR